MSKTSNIQVSQIVLTVFVVYASLQVTNALNVLDNWFFTQISRFLIAFIAFVVFSYIYKWLSLAIKSLFNKMN